MSLRDRQFTKTVPLPSEGFFYEEGSPLSEGVVEMRYMTAAEEDIIADESLRRKGLMLDRLLKALVVTPCDVGDLLTGDKACLIIAARMLAYGPEYTFTVRSQRAGDVEDVTIDLGDLDTIKPNFDGLEPGVRSMPFQLPVMDIPVVFRLLTHKDEQSMQQRLTKEKRKRGEASTSVTTRLSYHLVEVDGTKDRGEIEHFVRRQMLAADSRALRARIREVTPNIDLSFDYENSMGEVERLPISLEPSFFFPSLRDT